jgi:hypothetical protein
MSLIDELKEISIVDYLVSNGYPIVKESGGKVFFSSPFRGDSNPSFVVYRNNNTWVDFGKSSRTASIIDLIQELNGCSTVEAMNILKNEEDICKFEPVEVSIEPLLAVYSQYDKLISPELMLYMRSRGIPESIYSRHCKEVHYRFRDNPEKNYFGVGWANDKGGWEIRNKSHKYCSSPKSITTVTNDGGTLTLFEGWINYLSALVYFDIERFEGTTIVLNGLGMLYSIADTLRQYQKINCFLDWGRGGDDATELIKTKVGINQVYDHRYLWNFDEDFNDMLIRINK